MSYRDRTGRKQNATNMLSTADIPAYNRHSINEVRLDWGQSICLNTLYEAGRDKDSFCPSYHHFDVYRILGNEFLTVLDEWGYDHTNCSYMRIPSDTSPEAAFEHIEKVWKRAAVEPDFNLEFLDPQPLELSSVSTIQLVNSVYLYIQLYKNRKVRIFTLPDYTEATHNLKPEHHEAIYNLVHQMQSQPSQSFGLKAHLLDALFNQKITTI